MKHVGRSLGLFAWVLAAGCLPEVPGEGTSAGGVMCGGIAGFPCPGAGICVDDPTDDCDPVKAADCAGICVCRAAGPCGAGSHFEQNPKLCACVVDDPCATVRCAAETHCEAPSGTAVCVPNNACGTTSCLPGTHCEPNGSGGVHCVKDDPCAVVLCHPGTHCEPRATSVECVKDGT